MNLRIALLNAGVPFAGGHFCILANDRSPALDIEVQKTFLGIDEAGVSQNANGSNCETCPSLLLTKHDPVPTAKN
jgi:hypothetical protein